MRQEGEPSVDQILQSIKRVMARDRRPVPAEVTSADGMSEEVAIEEVADDDGVAREAVADYFVADDGLAGVAGEELPSGYDPEIDAIPGAEALSPAEADALMGDPDGERVAEVEALAVEDDDFESGAGDPATAALTSDEAADSMRRSLAALSMLAQPGAPLPTSAAGAASLDAVVKDMLRPMLAQWLDTHLPGLVEREVKAEIARITGG